jgi:hypothetical protein
VRERCVVLGELQVSGIDDDAVRWISATMLTVIRVRTAVCRRYVRNVCARPCVLVGSTRLCVDPASSRGYTNLYLTYAPVKCVLLAVFSGEIGFACTYFPLLNSSLLFSSLLSCEFAAVLFKTTYWVYTNHFANRPGKSVLAERNLSHSVRAANIIFTLFPSTLCPRCIYM